MRAGPGAEPSRHPRFQPRAAEDSPFPKSSRSSAGAGFCLPPQWSPRRRALGARLPRRSSGVPRGGDRRSWGDARRLIPPRGHARAHHNYTRRSHIHMLTEARSHADPDTHERPGSLAISAFSEQNHIKFSLLQTARQSEEPHAAFFCQGGWVGGAPVSRKVSLRQASRIKAPKAGAAPFVRGSPGRAGTRRPRVAGSAGPSLPCPPPTRRQNCPAQWYFKAKSCLQGRLWPADQPRNQGDLLLFSPHYPARIRGYRVCVGEGGLLRLRLSPISLTPFAPQGGPVVLGSFLWLLPPAGV